MAEEQEEVPQELVATEVVLGAVQAQREAWVARACLLEEVAVAESLARVAWGASHSSVGVVEASSQLGAQEGYFEELEASPS